MVAGSCNSLRTAADKSQFLSTGVKAGLWPEAVTENVAVVRSDGMAGRLSGDEGVTGAALT